MENTVKEIDSVITLLKDQIRRDFNKENYGDIVRNVKELLDRSIDSGYKQGEYEALTLLGHASFNVCDYGEAQEYFFRSLDKAEEMEDEKRMAFSLNNIGIINFRHGRFEKALDLYEKALEIKLKLNDEPSIATAYSNIGLIHSNLKDHRKAKEYFLKAYDIDKKNENHYAISRELNNLGIAYKNLGDKKKSLECYIESYEISATESYNKGMASALSNISKHYMDNGDPREAIEKALEGEMLAVQLNSNNHLLHFYSILSESYEKTGDAVKALEYFKKYVELKDRIYSEETNSKIIEMQIKYETERKHRESEEFRLKSEELAAINATKDKFFRIIHHDLLNPFTAIQSTANFLKNFYDKINDEKRISYIDMILNSSNRLQKLMDNLFSWVKAQSGEIDYHPEKTDLHEIAGHNLELFSNNLHSKEINASIDIKGKPFVNADRNMTDTIIRNLIGNAIKFTYNGGNISILIEEKKETVSITVEDNGTGIEQENIPKLFDVSEAFTTPGTDEEKGTGLGLILSREFTDINKGTIKVESQLNKGSRFIVELPKYF